MFCYCATARRLARVLTSRYDAALAPAGVSAAQFELLSYLQALQPCSGGALAKRLVTDKSTLSRNLQSLIDDGLVSSKPDRDDARHRLYALTAKGRARLGKAQPLWRGAHKRVQAELGASADGSEAALSAMAGSL